jgi:hypothetical protein
MAWINVIPYNEAEGKVKSLYERVKGPDNNVDNIMMMHSLRPHSMEGTHDDVQICASSHRQQHSQMVS